MKPLKEKVWYSSTNEFFVILLKHGFSGQALIDAASIFYPFMTTENDSMTHSVQHIRNFQIDLVYRHSRRY